MMAVAWSIGAPDCKLRRRTAVQVKSSALLDNVGSTDLVAVAPPAMGCPFAHAAPSIQRSHADIVVRRLLRIREASGVSNRQAVNAFRKSMVLSAIRCSLTYMVFPFVLPALGLVTETGVVIGIAIGALAMTCDVFSIRRFFVADHKWRWQFSAFAFSVMCLLGVLLVQDIVHLVG